MKRIFSILRIIGLLVLAIVLAEATLETGDKNIFEAILLYGSSLE